MAPAWRPLAASLGSAARRETWRAAPRCFAVRQRAIAASRQARQRGSRRSAPASGDGMAPSLWTVEARSPGRRCARTRASEALERLQDFRSRRRRHVAYQLGRRRARASSARTTPASSGACGGCTRSLVRGALYLHGGVWRGKTITAPRSRPETRQGDRPARRTTRVRDDAHDQLSRRPRVPLQEDGSWIRALHARKKKAASSTRAVRARGVVAGADRLESSPRCASPVSGRPREDALVFKRVFGGVRARGALGMVMYATTRKHYPPSQELTIDYGQKYRAYQLDKAAPSSRRTARRGLAGRARRTARASPTSRALADNRGTRAPGLDHRVARRVARRAVARAGARGPEQPRLWGAFERRRRTSALERRRVCRRRPSPRTARSVLLVAETSVSSHSEAQSDAMDGATARSSAERGADADALAARVS